MKGTLTPEKSESEEFEFIGDANILIVGDGEVEILRKVGDSDFYPMTDAAGEAASFSNDEFDGVIFNADISNYKRSTRFKLRGTTESEIHYIINWEW